ncbi:hypothetical protein LTR15_004452 [Elasticomyces elasticus]|nr:hypothetical protein LTR15_004452 [Elasticomyces elasticus]
MARARIQPKNRRARALGRARIENDRPTIEARLRARGIRFSRWASQARLYTLLKLAEKFLPYTNYKTIELRGFCQQRGLTILPKALKKDLIAVLEGADAKPSFRRFMELPAELRLEVLEFAGEKHEVVETLWWLDNKDRLRELAELLAVGSRTIGCAVGCTPRIRRRSLTIHKDPAKFGKVTRLEKVPFHIDHLRDLLPHRHVTTLSLTHPNIRSLASATPRTANSAQSLSMPPGIQTARGRVRPAPNTSWIDEMKMTATKNKLSARGVRVDQGVPIEELQNMLALSEKNLLAYTNYGRRKLQGFCYARRVPIKPSMLVRDLVHVLRAADAEPRFRRFFDLPAELRLMVVEAAGLEYEVVLAPKPRRSERVMAKKEKLVVAKSA